MSKTETKQCPYCKMDIAPLDRHAHEVVAEHFDLTSVRVTCILQRYYRIVADRPEDRVDDAVLDVTR